MKRLFIALLVLTSIFSESWSVSTDSLYRYIDPKIGSEGLGRVFVGPSYPFGMVKPSPDCTPSPNSGWLPMPERVDGFSQIHVSGTGGGPKYGNILIMPFNDNMQTTSHIDYRLSETIQPGYYATIFRKSGIQAEVTTARRASFYTFTYPQTALKGLMVDAGFFLGEAEKPDAREAQQLVGSEIQIVSSNAVAGYSRIRGGWNNGPAYTVYFYLEADQPFVETKTWKDGLISTLTSQFDSGKKTGALLRFPNDVRQVHVKIGISFLSALRARENLHTDIPHWSFSLVRNQLNETWESLLQRITIDPTTPEKYKRMFYTGIYHTYLMPVDRTGENPLWNDPEPYFDDYYAIWDTYRTSSPLMTLMTPDRQRDIIQSMLYIYRRDGYMPDARSGNANGRTQGGSNGEIVIADAFVKGLKGIDYELALKAMLKDAEVPPGGNEEAEGRGGLVEYKQLGYIPYGIPRAGNRTVEYAFCDYAIGVVAEGLGHQKLAKKYMDRANNWKNLWRSDYTDDGVRGFILPRDAQGKWLDEVPFGKSSLQPQTFTYTPTTSEAPWYQPWWSTFFYEATSWEYSLSIPHDVPGLITACGGTEAFEHRLDKFFDKGYYNVNNEPSFLTPCLYHWIGRPDRSSDRVHEIIEQHFGDSPKGLPGNDDSGAMSSWLVFHMMGLYPNAGTPLYLIHTPLLRKSTLTLANGKTFTIEAQHLSAQNKYIRSAKLNGKPYSLSAITHAQLMQGGKLELIMGRKPSNWGKLLQNEQ